MDTDKSQKRCHHCDRPHATDEEWDTVEEGTREDLCWSGGGDCWVQGVDWRSRALKAEIEYRKLRIKEIKMIISYNSDNEMLVCSQDQEGTLLKEYFTEGGRELEDYDRQEHDEVLEISSNLKAW